MNDMTIAPRQAPTQAGFSSADSFELAQRGAKLLASADLMPARYKGKVADCMIVLEMAQRLGANPLLVAQNLYVVHGTPAWSAQFVISCINSAKRFSALRYEIRGEDPKKQDYAVRAWTTERGSDERLYGPWIDWQTVKAEGWDSKSGSKWKSIPDLMFRYRAAAWWGRTYAPELTMGLRTVEEEAEIIDVTPRAGSDVLHEINRQIEGPAADEGLNGDGDGMTGDTESPDYAAQIAQAKTHDDLDMISDSLEDMDAGPELDALRKAMAERRHAIGGE